VGEGERKKNDYTFPFASSFPICQVAWLRVESKTILTIHHHIITRNYRIGLSHSDDKHWNLHISDVQESDRGGYMCQINTVPMKFQVGYLDVVVPPEISSDTLTDITVRENQNVTLKCSAKGHPKPTIRWRREDGRPIEFGNWQEKKTQGIDPPDTLEGETITIRKVSRLHMGAYLAIASNGVPPSVSKRILLNVHFPPMIWVPNQLIGAGVGSDAVLTCNTEAFPVSINYWTKEGEDALMPSDKYDINIVEKSYKIFMTLRIRDLTPEDFTSYKCYARNALGSTQGSIKLYEVRLPALRTDTRKKVSASSVGSQAEKFYLKRPSSLLIIGILVLFLLPCYSCSAM